MKVSANSVRVGNVVEHQGKLWRVSKKMHTMPGKGGAFVQLEMKELQEGTKLNERFRSSEDVMVARLDTEEYQYLFHDADNVTLMDNKTYEQITLSMEMLGDQAPFLQEGMVVMVESYQEKPVSVTLPEEVVLEIVETESVVKGQTAASSYKPAILSNGVRTMIPPFIAVGEKVKVKTEDGAYVERAK